CLHNVIYVNKVAHLQAVPKYDWPLAFEKLVYENRDDAAIVTVALTPAVNVKVTEHDGFKAVALPVRVQIVFNCQLARAIGRVWPANHILARLAFQYAVNRCRRCKDEALDSGPDAVVQQLKRRIHVYVMP